MALAKKYGVEVKILDAPVTRNGVVEERPSLDSLERLFIELQKFYEGMPYSFETTVSDYTVVTEDVPTRALIGNTRIESFNSQKKFNEFYGNIPPLDITISTNYNVELKTTMLTETIVSQNISSTMSGGPGVSVSYMMTNVLMEPALCITFGASDVTVSITGRVYVSASYSVYSRLATFNYTLSANPV